MSQERRGTVAFIAMMASLGLIGCTTPQVRPAKPDPVDVALSDAARSVERAWQTENAVVIAATLKAAPRDLPVAQLPVPFQTHVDMDWQGELAPAVRVLTEQLGYAFHEIGMRPVPPILISLSDSDQPVGEFLRRAGIQAGKRADVSIGDHEVSVIYSDGTVTDGR
ncbi:MAG: DotD/TraH family lipoprotein [Dokdonella sp.]